MKRTHGFLVFLTVAMLIAAGSLTTLTKVPEAVVTSDAAALSPTFENAAPSMAACSGDVQPMGEPGTDGVKPGCCSTQCNVDKDCDKICGKGNCACIQENPCCRRCVY